MPSRLIGLWPIALLTACASIGVDDGALPCSPAQECPQGYYCAIDDHCWRSGGGPGTDLAGSGGDSAAASDGGPDASERDLSVPADLRPGDAGGLPDLAGVDGPLDDAHVELDASPGDGGALDAMVDAPMDAGLGDDGSPGDAAVVDLNVRDLATVDLVVIPKVAPPSTVWRSSGGGTFTAGSGAQIQLSIGQATIVGGGVSANGGSVQFGRLCSGGE